MATTIRIKRKSSEICLAGKRTKVRATNLIYCLQV